MKQARFVLQGVSRSVRSREGALKEPGGRRSTTVAAGLAHEDGVEDEVATENSLNLLSPGITVPAPSPGKRLQEQGQGHGQEQGQGQEQAQEQIIFFFK